MRLGMATTVSWRYHACARYIVPNDSKRYRLLIDKTRFYHVSWDYWRITKCQHLLLATF